MSSKPSKKREPSLESKITGSLVGVAVADALGAPAEFHTRGTFEKIESMIPNKNFNLEKGYWTDDTSMTLCLALSLVECKGKFIIQDQIRKYIKWYQYGFLSSIGFCFDIGGATRGALGTWSRYFQMHPEIDDMDPRAHEDCLDLIEDQLDRKTFCGNGSLMRVSPIALVYHYDLEKAQKYAARSSKVTHPYDTNTEACVLYTVLLVNILRSMTKDYLARIIREFPYKDPDLKARLRPYRDVEDWQHRSEKDIKSSGYVVDSLEAALWSFFKSHSFREGAVRVVNLGDDADTVGAIYGALAGAYYGIEAIPSDWLSDLQKKEVIMKIAKDVADLSL